MTTGGELMVPFFGHFISKNKAECLDKKSVMRHPRDGGMLDYVSLCDAFVGSASDTEVKVRQLL
jgi:hypothetical protein